jgi:FixJ family two-component response regulator
MAQPAPLPAEASLTVFVVDDDPSIRDSLALMLGLDGFRTSLFASAEDCLAAWRADWAGCIVADLRMPGMSGIDLQAQLRARGCGIPFVIITGHGDVANARAAFRAEAVDFLEKPFEHAQLLEAINTAYGLEARRLQHTQMREDAAGRLAALTPREQEVLREAARGLHAKEIAATLGISPRTVEVHKTRIMAKLGVRNVAELVRFAVAAEGGQAPPEE